QVITPANRAGQIKQGHGAFARALDFIAGARTVHGFQMISDGHTINGHRIEVGKGRRALPLSRRYRHRQGIKIHPEGGYRGIISIGRMYGSALSRCIASITIEQTTIDDDISLYFLNAKMIQISSQLPELF